MDQLTPKTGAPDSTLAFTLTVGQIDEIVRKAVQSALEQDGHGSPLLTPDELADQLKVPVSWVYEKSRQGEIPTHRIGRYPRFRLEEVVQSQQKKQPRS
jgi:excisionase family DNA binding protein